MKNRKVENQVEVNVDDVVVQGIASFKENGTEVWTGTMTALQKALSKSLGKRQAQFLPGSPSALRVVIDRSVRRLRARGVSVKFDRANDRIRTRIVQLAF